MITSAEGAIQSAFAVNAAPINARVNCAFSAGGLTLLKSHLGRRPRLIMTVAPLALKKKRGD